MQRNETKLSEGIVKNLPRPSGLMAQVWRVINRKNAAIAREWQGLYRVFEVDRSPRLRSGREAR